MQADGPVEPTDVLIDALYGLRRQFAHRALLSRIGLAITRFVTLPFLVKRYASHSPRSGRLTAGAKELLIAPMISSRDDSRVKSELQAFCRVVATRGLLASTCGNASLRADPDHFVITASGAELGTLGPEAICCLPVAGGAAPGSGPRPSMEAELHRLIFFAHPAVNAVLHCQSRAATVLACMARPPLDLNFVPELPVYVKEHAYVPYFNPGSEDLARAVCAAFEAPDVTVVQMKNHGQVVIGRDYHDVVRRATFFEFACDIALGAQGLDRISPAEVALLKRYVV
jgi:ribulose-5-phosphate 4-epimerase/fuculose-1-phosphate aldolase